MLMRRRCKSPHALVRAVQCVLSSQYTCGLLPSFPDPFKIRARPRDLATYVLNTNSRWHTAGRLRQQAGRAAAPAAPPRSMQSHSAACRP
eukprot:COSAG01_NODE_18240_length_1090_cov_1.529768_2_plen_90_part_00